MKELNYLFPCKRINGVWVQGLDPETTQDKVASEFLSSKLKTRFFRWASVIGTEDEEKRKAREREWREKHGNNPFQISKIAILKESALFLCLVCHSEKPVFVFNRCQHPAFCRRCVTERKSEVAEFREVINGKVDKNYYRCRACDGPSGSHSLLVSLKGSKHKIPESEEEDLGSGNGGRSSSESQSQSQSQSDDEEIVVRPKHKNKKHKPAAKTTTASSSSKPGTESESDGVTRVQIPSGDEGDSEEDIAPKKKRARLSKNNKSAENPKYSLPPSKKADAVSDSGNDGVPESPCETSD